MSWIRNHWQLMALTATVIVLWQTQLVYPLRILVVLMHEGAHGLAGVLTGGTIISMDVVAQEGGVAVIQGGNGFAIATAGYLGSLLIGVAILLGALNSRADRVIMGTLGAITLFITVFYFEETFAILFGLIGGGVMLAMASFLGHDINDLILRVIGLTSMIYVPYDIFSDTIQRSHLRSDARILAENYFGSTMFWGVIWLAISLVIIGLCLRYGLGQSSNLRLGPKNQNT